MRHHLALLDQLPPNLLRGITAYWLLGEASGNRADSAGSHTLSPVNTPGNTTGISGNCLSLNGTNQYLEIAAGSAGDFDPVARDFAASVWVKPTAGGTGDRTIVSKYVATGNLRSWRLRTNNFEPQFTVSLAGNDTPSVLWGSTISSGAWHHIAFGKNGKRLWMSVDGGLVKSAYLTGSTLFSGATPFRVGALGDATALWVGQIDELAYWGARTLQSDEAVKLWGAGSGRFYPF